MVRALLRIVCFAGLAFGAAIVLAALASGSASAHAAAPPSAAAAAPPDQASGTDFGTPAGAAAEPLAVTNDDSSMASPLWADPATLSATASRRVSVDASREAPLASVPEPASEPPSAPAGPPRHLRAPASLVTISTPIGSFGTGGGTPDAGPSIAQLAVLAAALLGVLWLSQQLRASELRWRSALITLSIERPG